jgi:methionyl-tRNA formyltransferase
LRTVYLGTSPFAAAVLARLADSAHRPALVVSRPDRPRGRGRALRSPAVAELARELGLDLIQPEALHAPDVLERMAAAVPEALVVCAYGVLIREPLLSAHEIFNVHPSLLPALARGRAGRAGDHGRDERTGVSIMRLTEGLDSGPVCLAAGEPIAPDDDYGSLAVRLQALGGELLERALDERPAWEDQDESGATYAHKIEAADRALDPGRAPAALERTVRALRPPHRRAARAGRRRVPRRAACATGWRGGRDRAAGRRGAAAARLPRGCAGAARGTAAGRAGHAGGRVPARPGGETST